MSDVKQIWFDKNYENGVIFAAPIRQLSADVHEMYFKGMGWVLCVFIRFFMIANIIDDVYIVLFLNYKRNVYSGENFLKKVENKYNIFWNVSAS